MDDQGEPESGPTRRRTRVLGRLPKIAVSDRTEMAQVLRTYRWLLKRTARREFGDTPDAELVVRTTVMKVLAREDLATPHALALVLQVLRNECLMLRRRQLRARERKSRREEAGAPVDSVLGPLVGRTAEAVTQLPAKERQALLLAFEGLGAVDIASLLDEQVNTIRKRLARGRQKVRAWRDDERGQVTPSFLLGLAGRGPIRWRAGRLGETTRLGRWARAVSDWPRSLGSVADIASAGTAVAPVQLAIVTLVGLVALTGSLAASGGVTNAPAVRSAGQQTADTLTRGGAKSVSDARSSVSTQSPLLSLRHLPGSATVVAGPASSANAEQPDDAELLSAAQSDGGKRSTVVALGVGHTCACIVLFESNDRGRSWNAASGPPAGEQVALPPAYPQDPRIFIGTSPAGTSGPLVAAQFGATFQLLSGELPPGHVGLASGFDSGDQRVFVAGKTGVVSQRLGEPTVSAVVVYPPLDNAEAASLATPIGASAPSILIAAPAGATMVAPLNAQGVVNEAPTSLAGSPQLIACGPSGGCSVVSAIPLAAVEAMGVSPDYASDQSLYVVGAGKLAASVDGGRTFTVLDDGGHGQITSAAMAGGGVWTVSRDNVEGRQLRHLTRTRSLGWAPVGLEMRLATAGTLVALSIDRLLYLSNGHGYLCSSDAGQSWSRPCPG